MLSSHRIPLAILAVIASPGFAVESIYLDAVPVTNPGEFLAPANLYFQVPPPSVSFKAAGSLAPATVYDFGILNSSTVGLASGSYSYSGYSSRADSESESESSETTLRVLLKAGLDNASDVPLAVLREHLAESETITLVDEGDTYDVLVEIETMKLAASQTIFVVINAYKDVDDESLIFYNNFGYLGEMKLLSGSISYATKLESALEQEADRLHK